MGLLTEGNPLSWYETKKLSNYVRERGLNQFINLYHCVKNRVGDVFKWGDEIEYMLIKFDDECKVAQVSLSASKVLAILNQRETENPKDVKSLWRSEYGEYMIEGSPGKPYVGLLSYIDEVEANMNYRRQEVTKLLHEDEAVITFTNFPRLGAPNFTWPIHKPQPNNKNGISCSLYFPDEAISLHPKYNKLTSNILHRRGEKVDIRLKVFKDENTQIPVDGSPINEPDVVHMDAVGFAAGCCCLQSTFQASNVAETRILYDQLATLCPIMLALTASSPIFRGYLVDSDCRWPAMTAGLDCRTAEERGEAPLKENQFRIQKSRYDSIDSYLSPEGIKYNDVALVYNEKTYQKLIDAGIDHLMAQHIAYLFLRDPLVLLSEKVHKVYKDEVDTYHFENMQSTDWRTLRIKLPIPNTDIGWRDEFRPCEVQLTDFENAAIACFMALMTRVILFYRLNFLIPISKIDENMEKAHKRNAYRDEQFWFRKDIFDKDNNSEISTQKCNKTGNPSDDQHHQHSLMTIDQIINGTSFVGLISLINDYVSANDVGTHTHFTIQRYLRLITDRASGKLLTTAAWIRKEIVSHPEYKKDSVVTEHINFDLLKKVKEIQEGTRSCAELHGSLNPTSNSCK